MGLPPCLAAGKQPRPPLDKISFHLDAREPAASFHVPLLACSLFFCSARQSVHATRPFASFSLPPLAPFGPGFYGPSVRPWLCQPVVRASHLTLARHDKEGDEVGLHVPRTPQNPPISEPWHPVNRRRAACGSETSGPKRRSTTRPDSPPRTSSTSSPRWHHASPWSVASMGTWYP